MTDIEGVNIVPKSNVEYFLQAIIEDSDTPFEAKTRIEQYLTDILEERVSTLVGPWVSSMDAYDPNTTPTIGAQVVDMGGTETIYNLTPHEISALLGRNNIWSDSGDVKVTLKGGFTDQGE